MLTVNGDISTEELGVTLTHEHLSLNLDKFFTPLPSQYAKYVNEKITAENFKFIKQYPYCNKFNLRLDDKESEEAVMIDVAEFKNLGGGSIVENTNYELDRNLEFLHQVAQKTGVNVIAGTGHHIEISQRVQTLNMRVEEIVDLYSREIEEGVNISSGKMIKCGFIGEVGSVYPMTDFERKSIQATAVTQSTLKCGVSFHPGTNSKAPFEIIRIYLEAGGDVEKCVMSHLDFVMQDTEDLLEFSKLGCYCQMDLFGMEYSVFQEDGFHDMPSDDQRIDRLKILADEGNIDRILISNDVHTKHRLV